MGRLVAICIVFLMCLSAASAAASQPQRKGPSKLQLSKTNKDVNDKLQQLHKVIDALQLTVKHMSDGHNKQAQENSEKMKAKFVKLSSVISNLSKQNNQLHGENKRLKHEKNSLVNKIADLEVQLKKQAEAANSVGAEAWLRDTASELKKFLEGNGLEHFESPEFSPIVAGIVSNGVIILPLGITSIFLLHYAKQLNVLRIVMALNLFDLGFALAILVSSALLLGDPFEGMRHISEVNFVFIQLVVAAVFWLTFGFCLAAIVRHRKNKACRFIGVELGLRIGTALDYFKRVWVPVMERDDVPIALPAIVYMIYLLAAVIAVKLTATANRVVFSEHKQGFRREEDSQILGSTSAQRDSHV